MGEFKTGLLSDSDKPTSRHFQILLMSWAGWMFDFYDLILYTFLLIPIKKELHLTDIEVSFVLGASLAATALGGNAGRTVQLEVADGRFLIKSLSSVTEL